MCVICGDWLANEVIKPAKLLRAYTAERLQFITGPKQEKTGLHISCSVQIVGSEFGINNMKAWIHLALYQQFGLVVA